MDTLIKARGKRVTVQAILQNFNDLRSQGESSEDVSRVKGVIQVLRNKFNVLKENKKYDPFFVNNSQYNLGCRVTHK